MEHWRSNVTGALLTALSFTLISILIGTASQMSPLCLCLVADGLKSGSTIAGGALLFTWLSGGSALNLLRFSAAASGSAILLFYATCFERLAAVHVAASCFAAVLGLLSGLIGSLGAQLSCLVKR